MSHWRVRLAALLLVLPVHSGQAAPPPAAQWFVPAPPNAAAVVDLGAPLAPGTIGSTEEIIVKGRRRPAAGPLDIPNLPSEDMSRYRRLAPDITREHRPACAPNYATVGGHEGRGSSLATGLGAAGCD